MDHPLLDLINARLRKAEKEGAFDNLPGAGKPLDLDTDPDAMNVRILKQNGAVPEFVQLSRDIAAKHQELKQLTDDTERKAVMKEIALLEIKKDLARKAGV